VALVPGTEVQTSGSIPAGSRKVAPTPVGRTPNSYGGSGHSTGGAVEVVEAVVVVVVVASVVVVVVSTPGDEHAAKSRMRIGTALVAVNGEPSCTRRVTR
jgi:hypothetical protein